MAGWPQPFWTGEANLLSPTPWSRRHCTRKFLYFTCAAVLLFFFKPAVDLKTNLVFIVSRLLSTSQLQWSRGTYWHLRSDSSSPILKSELLSPCRILWVLSLSHVSHMSITCQSRVCHVTSLSHVGHIVMNSLSIKLFWHYHKIPRH